MLFTLIEKKDILNDVQEVVSRAQKEIIATMYLQEELQSPLPKSYFQLLHSKLSEGIVIKRLGFGSKEDYNTMRNIIRISNKRYQFKYLEKILEYQRLIIIDRKIAFLGISGIFLKSTHEPFIQVVLKYFLNNFKKAKI